MKIQTKGTKEWSDISYNIMHGCVHSCEYCYARQMDHRFGRSTEVCMKDPLPKIPKGKRVMFPTTHDLHKGEIETFTYTIIRLIENENSVLFTTKADHLTFKSFLDNFEKKISQETHELGLKAYDKLEFRFSITCKDNNLIDRFEKNTGFYEQRLANLRYADRWDYKTSVSIEPLLCSKSDLDLIMLEIEPIASEIWIGTLSSIPESMIETVSDFYTRENLEEIYHEYKGNRTIKFKDTFLNRMERTSPSIKHIDLMNFAGVN